MKIVGDVASPANYGGTNLKVPIHIQFLLRVISAYPNVSRTAQSNLIVSTHPIRIVCVGHTDSKCADSRVKLVCPLKSGPP